MKSQVRIIKTMVIILWLMAFNHSAFAFHRYIVWNAGFEAGTENWGVYPDDGSAVTSQDGPVPVPDGDKAARFRISSGHATLWQTHSTGTGYLHPKAGETVKARARVWIDDDMDLASGSFALIVYSLDPGGATPLTRFTIDGSNTISKGEWVIIETTSSENGGKILLGATGINVVFEDQYPHATANIFVDWVELGTSDHPPALDLAYHTQDPGFEGQNTDAVWRQYTENAFVSTSDAFAYEGMKSMEMSCDSGPPHGTAVIWQIMSAKNGPFYPGPGDEVRALAWVYLPAGFSFEYGEILIRIESVDMFDKKTDLALGVLHPLDAEPAGRWVLLETRSMLDDPNMTGHPGVVPEDAHTLQLAVESRAPGSIHVDAITWGRENPQTAATITHPYEPQNYDPPKGDLDFEDDFDIGEKSEEHDWGSYPFPHTSHRSIQQYIKTGPGDSKVKSGTKSVKLFRGTDTQVGGSEDVVAFWAEIPLGTDAIHPKPGHKIVGGMWVYADSDCDLSKPGGYIEAKIDSVYMDGGEKRNFTIAKTYNLTPAVQKEKWVYVSFHDYYFEGEVIPHAFEIALAVVTNFPGTIYVDDVRIGTDYEQPEPVAAPHQYTILNHDFEETSLTGWGTWGPVALDVSNGYYGNQGVQMITNSAMWASVPANAGPGSPQGGEKAEGGVWAYFNVDLSSMAVDDFYILLESEDLNTGVKTQIAKSRDITLYEIENGKWIYFKTEPTGAGEVLGDAEFLTLSISNSLHGNVVVDFVQAGVEGSVNGNPERFTIGEFHQWYGNESIGWYNWEYFGIGTPYAHDPDTIKANGQRDIASSHYPLIGAYDSGDPDVIQWQVDLSKAMLIDCLFVNWYGDPAVNNYADPARFTAYKNAFNTLITKAEEKGLKACMFYEPKIHFDKQTVIYEPENNSRGERIQGVINDIKSICATWGDRKGYLHYNGKPVVAVYGLTVYGLTAPEWQEIYDGVTQEHPVHLIGNLVRGGEDLETYYPVFGGMCHWRTRPEFLGNHRGIDWNPLPQTISDYSKYMNRKAGSWAGEDPMNRHAISIIWPGFDDRGVYGWSDDPEELYFTPGRNGDFYLKTQEGASLAGANWVMIATMNDWNEGTSIEPYADIPDPYLYCKMTQNFIEDFKGVPAKDDNLMRDITEAYLAGHDYTRRLDMGEPVDREEAGYSGAACVKMILDYEGTNSYTQTQLQDFGVSRNANTGITNHMDPKGMYDTLNHHELDPGYNYAGLSNATVHDAFHSLCYWLAYEIPGVSPNHMPGAIPLGGDYASWVIVNGYSTDADPLTSASYGINGFWIIDPRATGGIGKNVFITGSHLMDQFPAVSIAGDDYENTFVTVNEPPEHPAFVTVNEPEAYPVFTREDVLEAAIRGVKTFTFTNNGMKKAFQGTVPDEPILVKKNDDAYYILPFKKGNGVMVAVIIDAKTGAFRQASYVERPDKTYLKRFKAKQRVGRMKPSESKRGANGFVRKIDRTSRTSDFFPD